MTSRLEMMALSFIPTKVKGYRGWADVNAAHAASALRAARCETIRPSEFAQEKINTEAHLDLTISIESLEDDQILSSEVDLADAKSRFTLIVAFGNGVFDEVRVVGRTKLAALYFLRMVQALGVALVPGQLAPANARLHRPGDVYYAQGAVGISVAPQASSGERMDAHALDAEFAQCAASLEALMPAQPEPTVRPESGGSITPAQSSPARLGIVARVSRILKTRFDFSKQSLWVILMTMTYSGFGFRYAWSSVEPGQWIGLIVWGGLFAACVWGAWRKWGPYPKA